MTEPADILDHPADFRSAAADLPDDVQEPNFREAIRKFYGDKVAFVRKFWRTRKAILAGEPLWDLSPTQLRAANHYSGARFNLAESALAAAPGVIAGRFIDLLLPDPQVLTPVEKVQATISNTAYSAIVPFVLLIAARTIARATFRKGEGTPAQFERAKRAYLYLEGARSFIPELVISTAAAILIGFTRLPQNAPDEATTVAGAAIAVCLIAMTICAFWLRRIMTIAIPRELFRLNGYSDRRPAWWKLWTRDRTIGPWSRYATASRLKVPMIFGAVALSIHFIADGVARVVIWLRP